MLLGDRGNLVFARVIEVGLGIFTLDFFANLGCWVDYPLVAHECVRAQVKRQILDHVCNDFDTTWFTNLRHTVNLNWVRDHSWLRCRSRHHNLRVPTNCLPLQERRQINKSHTDTYRLRRIIERIFTLVAQVNMLVISEILDHISHNGKSILKFLSRPQLKVVLLMVVDLNDN